MRGCASPPAAALLAALLVHAGCGASRLPASLSDEAFRRLIEDTSEPPGEFVHSDSVVSNETHFAEMIRLLGARGGVFVGVGPEQNFSYIAGLRPAMAFVVDIRRENRDLHLLYKALFEVSADRAGFLSRLFARTRPSGLAPDADAAALFAAFAEAAPSPGLADETAALVRQRLDGGGRLGLTPADLASIETRQRRFAAEGPAIRYGQGELRGPTYAELMAATDLRRREQSYLADEARFAYVRDLHARNLIVPVVGDFGGPHALRRVGDWVRRHDAVVSVFYGSNVEVYLNRRQAAAFCASLAALPYGVSTWFVGNKGMRPLRQKLAACAAEAGP